MLLSEYVPLVLTSAAIAVTSIGVIEGCGTNSIADFVTVTTDYLKNFYHKHYGVPLENIISIPNLLPKWWFGDRYDPEKKV